MTTTLDPTTRNITSELTLIFQRVPYGTKVEWVENGEEVYRILRPMSKLPGDWMWGGEAALKHYEQVAAPTFQYGSFRMWSLNKGKQMVATRQPDINKLKEWVNKIVSH